MPAFQTLLFYKDDGVAHIALNRPQVLNAYNLQMRDDFSEVLAAAADDDEIKAVLISGEGRAFCSGADLTEVGTAPSLVKSREVRWERDVWGQLNGLSKPTVAAVHGYCIGSGVEIALFCDIRIAAQGTVFAMPEVQLGMVPAAGGTQTLSRNARTSVALDLLLTGRRFNSDEALAMKLITRVFPEERLLEEARNTARQLARVDTAWMSAARQALKQGASLSLSQGLQLETRLATMAI